MTAADGLPPAALPDGSHPTESVTDAATDDDRTARRAALRDLAAMIGVEVFY